nr:TIM barrel protein [Tessaracoccus sp. MC1865]
MSDWSPAEIADVVHALAERGATSVVLSDDDLVGPDGEPADDALITVVPALRAAGVRVALAWPDVTTHPVFADGALCAAGKGVRRFALAKVLRFVDLAAALGAETFVLHESRGSGWGRDPFADAQRLREAVDAVTQYIYEQGFELRVAVVTGPGSLLLTAVEGLGFRAELNQPEAVGIVSSGADLTGTAWAWGSTALTGVDLGRMNGDPLHQFRMIDLLERGSLAGQMPFAGHLVFRFPAPAQISPEQYVALASGAAARYGGLAQRVAQWHREPAVEEALSSAELTVSLDPTFHPGETPAQLTHATDTGQPEACSSTAQRLRQLTLLQALGVEGKVSAR